MKFLLGAKPGDREALFTALDTSEKTRYYEIQDERGFLHQFRFLNDTPLNKGNPDVRVNVLEYMQTISFDKSVPFNAPDISHRSGSINSL